MGFRVLIELGVLGVGITGFGKTELGLDEPGSSELDALTVPLSDEEPVGDCDDEPVKDCDVESCDEADDEPCDEAGKGELMLDDPLTLSAGLFEFMDGISLAAQPDSSAQRKADAAAALKNLLDIMYLLSEKPQTNARSDITPKTGLLIL